MTNKKSVQVVDGSTEVYEPYLCIEFSLFQKWDALNNKFGNWKASKASRAWECKIPTI